MNDFHGFMPQPLQGLLRNRIAEFSGAGHSFPPAGALSLHYHHRLTLCRIPAMIQAVTGIAPGQSVLIRAATALRAPDAVPRTVYKKPRGRHAELPGGQH